MASEGEKPFLPSEMIINILKRLPVKVLLRFRSVCKGWKNIIKTPHFIAEHASFSAHQNPLLLLHETVSKAKGKPPSSLRLVNHNMETVQALSTSLIDSFKYGYTIIGSWNGLVCIRVNLSEISPYNSSHSLWLWNPVIREIREITQTTRDEDMEWCEFGFGFSSAVNDYKIVKFYSQELSKSKNKKNVAAARNDRVQVYSLNTCSWKELDFKGSLQDTTIISKHASVDGTIFWLGAQKDSSHVLVSFDIRTQVFTLKPISLPFKRDNDRITSLGFHQNKFTILRYYNNASWNDIDVGVMEEFASESAGLMEEFLREFVGLMDEDVASEAGKSFNYIKICEIESMEWSFDLLCIWRDEIVIREENELKLFNVTTRKWKYFPDSADYVWYDGVNYEESLVSVWNTTQ